MGSFAKHMILCHTSSSSSMATCTTRRDTTTVRSTSILRDNNSSAPIAATRRSGLISTLAVAASSMLGRLSPAEAAEDIRWGTRSFIREKYFSPELSPEEAADRIRQTTEGLRDMRHMLDTMSWRYVMFYIRLKSAYLDSDLKNAMALLPDSRRKDYVRLANRVVDNMSELDRYVRTPKVYESYLYYEKTLQSLDDLMAML